MVSPPNAGRAFPAPPNPSNPPYAAVPNPRGTPDLSFSPNPDDPYARASGPYLSPDLPDSSRLLGRRGSDMYPAPSLLSRDSTHESLANFPNLPGSRASWGSGTALAANAEGIAGAERPRQPRSNLAHSSSAYNKDIVDDEQFVAPANATALPLGVVNEKTPRWADNGYKPKRSRKWLWVVLGLVVLAIAALGVGLGVGLSSKKHTMSSLSAASAANATATGTATSSAAPTASATATSGGMGSILTFEDGSTMTYNNSFGGTWYFDEADAFNNSAQAQSYTPPLSQNWTWGIDRIYGVNLGGWLNTEPFIAPALYEKYATGPSNQTAIDEYTLSLNMGDNLTAAMTEHYDTFITERDFAEIASAGLNWVRLPVPFWAIETWPGEPYLERVSWTYVLKSIQWARKYGIRINFDLHNAPGSENGWNHSGKLGSINWMASIMGLANAQRSLDYVRTLTQFIAQPEYAPIIQMFGFINEPFAPTIGQPQVGGYYLEAYRIIRDITGIGENMGPILALNDGFLGLSNWYDFAPGADRLALDQHSYYIFGNQVQGSLDSISTKPCSWWAVATNQTSLQFGINVAGEWSAAPNDCGLWVNGVGIGSRYDGSFTGYTGPQPGQCTYWNDYTQWNQSTIDDLLVYTKSSMDALQNFFFWTWKIGNSTGDITQVNPFWNYQLGLQHGWVPSDPRDSIGQCASVGVNSAPFDGTFASPYMTGGAGAGTVAADMATSFPWPPASLNKIPSASMSLLAQYTQTGTPITMPVPTFTSPGSNAIINAGSGWFNANADSRQAYAAVSGCSYPSEYSAGNSPTAGECGADLTQPTKRAAVPASKFPAPTIAPESK